MRSQSTRSWAKTRTSSGPDCTISASWILASSFSIRVGPHLRFSARSATRPTFTGGSPFVRSCWTAVSYLGGTPSRGGSVKFTVELEQESDGRWIGEVPELPGTLVYGASPEEATARAKALALRVLADRLEGLPQRPVIYG